MVCRRLYLLFLIAVAFTWSAAARADDLFRPREVIVRLRPGSDLLAFTKQYGLQVVDSLGGEPVFLLRTLPNVDPEALSTLLRRDVRVVWAEPNFIALTPETRGGQWTSTFDGGTDPGPYANQDALRQVGFREAAQRSNGSGVVVAILDTGISFRNSALKNPVVSGWNTLDNNAQTDDAPNSRDDNGNGMVDEGTGHGTMVAGIVARLAPRSALMPVKVLDSDGVGHLWALAEGILLAAGRGADLLNLSLGIEKRSILLEETIGTAYQLGAVVVTSAGNNNTSQPQYPAGIAQVLTVAALNANDTKASFSNYGWMIDVCAPGVRISSTNWNGRFAYGTGTSFAAPFVTGEVALIWAVTPSLSNSSVQSIARDTARNLDGVNPGYRGSLGTGVIQIDRAVLGLPK